MSLIDLLRDPAIHADIDLGEERVAVHRQILNRKPMIRGVFEEFYRRVRDLDEQSFGDTTGLRIELGAGSSLLKQYYPDVINSDIVPAPHLDRVLDASNLDLEDHSVRVLYGINCFHHFPDPAQFFREVKRVVRPGGGVILIDPYFGPLSAFMYKRLFASETFDKTAPGWRADEQNDPNRANQALSYVVLFRDAERFRHDNPDLKLIQNDVIDNYMRYLISGGLNFRQLLPTFTIGMLKTVEWVARPVRGLLGLHHIMVIRHEMQG